MSAKESIVVRVCLLLIAVLGIVAPVFISAQESPPADPAQAAKDARIVETLLRLKNIDLEAKPEVKQAVLRYLQSVEGTPRFLEVAEALSISDVSPQLIQLAIAHSEEPLGIQAGRAVFRMGQQRQIFETYREGDEATRVALIRVLGGIGNQATSDRLTDIIKDEKATRAEKQTAVQALLAARRGQETLAAMVEAGELPEELVIFTAGEIQRIGPPELRGRLANQLNLPETADAQPLPSLDELVRLQGNVETGRTVFFGKGTCGNCHVVGTEGKEVGPALTEIGAKLSRDAMFVSILDPSAAVSHNFETFVVETIDGEILQGIKVSETAELIVLKLADGQVREVPTEFVDLFQKQEVSLMPTGLQKNLTVDELVSLVDYLSTLKPAN